jgi:DNA-binding LacI/PurR family transcriptional regulator
MKKVTSFNVAEKAGVSRATVSSVINNVKKENISDKTKEKVMNEVRERGYIPNAAGKALASKCTRNIGLVSRRKAIYLILSFCRECPI